MHTIISMPGLYSLSGWSSYRQISWSLEAAKSVLLMIVSLGHWTATLAAALPGCLSNFRAIGKVWIRISRLRYFTRSCGKTPICLLNRNPGVADFVRKRTPRCSAAKSGNVSKPWTWEHRFLMTLTFDFCKTTTSKLSRRYGFCV